MTANLALTGKIITQAADGGLEDALRAVVSGPAPVREHHGWRQLAAWLAERGESPELVEATVTWLVSRRSGSDRTRDAYAADLSRWFAWCDTRSTHPVTARYQDADLYGAACREAGLSKATIGRRLAAVSSWYIYARRTEMATINPFDGMERPKVSHISPRRALTKRELATLLAYAKVYREDLGSEANHAAREVYRQSVAAGAPLTAYALAKAFGHVSGNGRVNDAWGRWRIREVQEGLRPATEAAADTGVAKRAYALLMTMTATAARIGDILGADADGLGTDSGYHTLDLAAKGDEFRRLVLPPPTVTALEDYLGGRRTGPLFMTATGARLERQYANRLLKSIARRAGISSAAELSTHAMRHSVATILLGNGTELQIVQGLLGHASSATTDRYNHILGTLESSPAGKMTDLIAAEMRLLESENE